MDREGIKLIENHDAEGFQKYIKATKNTICGRKPIQILLAMIELAKEMQLESRLVQYAQSEKVTEKRQSSVSYAAIVTYKLP